jgi:hypothetical protein
MAPLGTISTLKDDSRGFGIAPLSTTATAGDWFNLNGPELQAAMDMTIARISRNVLMH